MASKSTCFGPSARSRHHNRRSPCRSQNRKHPDRVLLDQRGKLFNRTHDGQVPRPAALFTEFNVTIENAALVEHAGADRGDCSDHREYGTGLHHSVSLEKPAGRTQTNLPAGNTTQWLAASAAGALAIPVHQKLIMTMQTLPSLSAARP